VLCFRTLSLDRIIALAVEAGAKVLLVGDYAQFQSPNRVRGVLAPRPTTRQS